MIISIVLGKYLGKNKILDWQFKSTKQLEAGVIKLVTVFLQELFLKDETPHCLCPVRLKKWLLCLVKCCKIFNFMGMIHAYPKIPKRPRVKLKWTPYEKIIELCGVLLLVGYWLWLSDAYKDLPDIIPNHFDYKGRPDAYGSKNGLWGLPRAVSLLYLILTVFSFFPQHFNYVEDITPENAAAKYRKAAATFRILKVLIVLVSLLISWFAISHAV